VYGVIEASLTMLEDQDRAIHSAALPCVTQFPWSVSSNLLILLLCAKSTINRCQNYSRIRDINRLTYVICRSRKW